MKILSIVCYCLLLVVHTAAADLNGSDDFDDDVIDSSKWAGLFGTWLIETNSRLEYIGGAGEVVEGLEWIANKGSYTNDWRVSIDVLISIDENALMNQSIQFILVAWYDSVDDNLSVEFEVGDEGGGTQPYRYIRTDVEDGGAVVLDEPIAFASDSARLWISFDASTKVLTSYYDAGGGMTVLTNYDVSDWGMTDTDKFTLAMAFESVDLSSVSGEVYADNFYAHTLATHYVDINSTNPVSPYTNWVTAATNIQDAIDASVDGETVLVADGLYLLSSTIRVTNDITIQGVNGRESTIVDGQNTVRCFYLGESECLVEGFTIMHGDVEYLDDTSGGVYCENTTPVVSDCTIVSNRAFSSYDDGPYTFTYYGGGMHYGTACDCSFIGNYGGMEYGIASNCTFIGNTEIGGMRYGTAYDCTFINNSSLSFGGGMRDGDAYNCTFTSNSAYYAGGGMLGGDAYNCSFIGNRVSMDGGGMYDGDAYNCTFIGNTAADAGGGFFGGTAYNCTFVGNTADLYGGMYWLANAYNCIFNDNYATNSYNDFDGSVVVKYSCSTQLVHGVDGNITNTPLFVGSGNYCLAPDSPCINAGSNGYVSVATDLNGNPRIIDGTVDMGAYEAFYVTNCLPSASGFALEWMSCPTGWNTVIMFSTNLLDMPFTNLSAPLPYPMNSYLIQGTAGECFYKVEIQP